MQYFQQQCLYTAVDYSMQLLLNKWHNKIQLEAPKTGIAAQYFQYNTTVQYNTIRSTMQCNKIQRNTTPQHNTIQQYNKLSIQQHYNSTAVAIHRCCKSVLLIKYNSNPPTPSEQPLNRVHTTIPAQCKSTILTKNTPQNTRQNEPKHNPPSSSYPSAKRHAVSCKPNLPRRFRVP